MIDMTRKQLRLIDTALGTHIAKLQSDRQKLQEDAPQFKQLSARIDEYASLQEDIEILLLRD